jgi:hypothetical protein
VRHHKGNWSNASAERLCVVPLVHILRSPQRKLGPSKRASARFKNLSG